MKHLHKYILSAIFLISICSSKESSALSYDAIKSITMTALENIATKSTPWDWCITAGSLGGVVHGMYTNKHDQSIAWGISLLASLTTQATRSPYIKSLTRFIAAGILVSHRTDLLTKLAHIIHEYTGVELVKKVEAFFSKHPEICGTVAGIIVKMCTENPLKK